jgi:hypothetical protein
LKLISILYYLNRLLGVMCILFLIIKLRSQYSITITWSVTSIPSSITFILELENTYTISTTCTTIYFVLKTNRKSVEIFLFALYNTPTLEQIPLCSNSIPPTELLQLVERHYNHEWRYHFLIPPLKEARILFFLSK